jgi:hypothetical protein
MKMFIHLEHVHKLLMKMRNVRRVMYLAFASAFIHFFAWWFSKCYFEDYDALSAILFIFSILSVTFAMIFLLWSLIARANALIALEGEPTYQKAEKKLKEQIIAAY